MPAVTVDNILTLPRIAVPDSGKRERSVLAITTAPKGVEGEGFPVRRAFYGLDQRFLDPFIHMDQMGEVEYGPGEPKGTAWHPHRGFERHAARLARRGCARPTDCRRAGRPRRPRPDPHADFDAACEPYARRRAAATLASRLQRPRVCPRRLWQRRTGACPAGNRS